MRVAMFYYPMLFQRTGGLQVQIIETARALQKAGLDVTLFDYSRHRLTEFDVAHVFSAINGNHRIVEQAKNDGLAVVLSTVLHPPWTRRQDKVAELLSRGCSRLTDWSINTTHQHVHHCLEAADALIALGKAEKKMLIEGYGVPAGKTHIIPNGIKGAFFNATGDLFRARFNVQGPYALNVASVSPYKNQMSALRALRGKLPLVVFGPCAEENRGYLEELKAYGGKWFHYLGTVDNDDPVLPSAYAGASLFILPSETEVQPISALEALAADCPVIITRHHSLDMLTDTSGLSEIEPDDEQGIAAAVERAISNPTISEATKRQLARLTWDAIAPELTAIYTQLTHGHVSDVNACYQPSERETPQSETE